MTDEQIDEGPADVSDGVVAVTGETTPKQPGVLRRSGFGWGVAAGAIVVVILVLRTVLYMYIDASARQREMSRAYGGSVSVKPVTAGEQWFTVNADGTGTLEAWSSGSSSSSGDGGDTEMTTEVFDVGSVDGVVIRHALDMGVDDSTKIYIGDKLYEPADSKKSAAEQAFGFGDEAGYNDALDTHKLSIEFRREGDRLVATQITVIPDSPAPPMMGD